MPQQTAFVAGKQPHEITRQFVSAPPSSPEGVRSRMTRTTGARVVDVAVSSNTLAAMRTPRRLHSLTIVRAMHVLPISLLLPLPCLQIHSRGVWCAHGTMSRYAINLRQGAPTIDAGDGAPQLHMYVSWQLAHARNKLQNVQPAISGVCKQHRCFGGEAG
jgi:hypothetical protein